MEIGALLSVLPKLSNSDIVTQPMSFDDGFEPSDDDLAMEAHVVSFDPDTGEIALIADDDEIHYVSKSDVVSVSEWETTHANVPGQPVEVVLKAGAKIRVERTMTVGVHLKPSSNGDVDVSGDTEVANGDTVSEDLTSLSNPPSGCKCARRCTRGWCCASGGWIYVCRRSACAVTRSRC